MISHTTARFRQALAALPSTIQQHAREAYQLFRENPAVESGTSYMALAPVVTIDENAKRQVFSK